MTTRKAVKRKEGARASAPGGPDGGRRRLTIQAVPTSATRYTGSVDTLQVQSLLQEAESVAGYLEHIAAVTESLQGGQNLNKESLTYLMENHDSISYGLSEVIAFYGVRLRSTAKGLRSRNAAELAAD